MNTKNAVLSSSGVENALLALLSLIVVSKLIILLSTFQCGLDLTDEGAHMLMYKFPQEYVVTIHNYHFMVTALLPKAMITVFHLRVCWLIIDVLASLILFGGCISILRFLGAVLPIRVILILFLFGANTLALSIHDRILAYNTFSTLFVYSSVGFLLLGLSRKELAPPVYILFFSAFFCISLQLFIKPTTAVAAGCMELALSVIFFKRHSIWILLCAFAGAGTAFLVMFLFILPPFNTWLPHYRKGFELAYTNGYGSNIMLVYLYLIPVLKFIFFIVAANLPVYFLLKIIKKKNIIPDNKWLLAHIGGHLSSSIILLVIIRLTAVRTFDMELWREAPDTFYTGVLLFPNTLVYQCLTIYGGLVERNKQRINLRIIAICLFLLVIPWTIFFGSFSHIDLSLYGHLLPIVALLIMVPYLFMKRDAVLNPTNYYIVSLTLLCSYFFLIHYIVYPTRMLEPLYAQRVLINEEGTLNDTSTASFIAELKHKVAACGNFKYGTQLGLQPGLIYLLGLKQPGTAFYLSMHDIEAIENMNVLYNDYFYGSYLKEIVQGPVIINAGVSEKDIVALNKRFDGVGCHLMLADSVYNPYLQREMHSNTFIERPFTYIYMPKRNSVMSMDKNSKDPLSPCN